MVNKPGCNLVELQLCNDNDVGELVETTAEVL